MRYDRVTGGHVLRRRSFRVLSLGVLPKKSAADTEGGGYLAVSFVGSLLDHTFGTSDRRRRPQN
ncbi:hypothetical protein [Streptomyces sp. NPDC059452]|uniref:hypothetical protein n=1 Tax=Streptomyces sp. NPDC059452 TaxID=3346835 RepID=UPI0036883C59